jgi:hypothetical protein
MAQQEGTLMDTAESTTTAAPMPTAGAAALADRAHRIAIRNGLAEHYTTGDARAALAMMDVDCFRGLVTISTERAALTVPVGSLRRFVSGKADPDLEVALRNVLVGAPRIRGRKAMVFALAMVA